MFVIRTLLVRLDRGFGDGDAVLRAGTPLHSNGDAMSQACLAHAMAGYHNITTNMTLTAPRIRVFGRDMTIALGAFVGEPLDA
jgi:hypothetical protein